MSHILEKHRKRKMREKIVLPQSGTVDILPLLSAVLSKNSNQSKKADEV